MLKSIMMQKSELETLLENPNNRAVLEKWLKFELTYTSNAIEGNTLTRREAELVIEEKITSSSKPFVYYQEAINHAKAFERVLEVLKNNLPIDEKEVLHLHKMILTGIDDDNAGFYRNCRVIISGSRVIMPNPLKISALMKDFFEWLQASDINNPMAAIESHYKFVTIHPFTDGNGRTARLLMNMLLMKGGFCPLIIRPIDRKRYISAIEKRQLTGAEESYFKIMQKALERSLKTVINLLDTSIEITNSRKLLTISKFAKLVGVPSSTIRYWVQTEKLKPIHYTDAGYMLFNEEQKEAALKIHRV